jgi:hypothetical protein
LIRKNLNGCTEYDYDKMTRTNLLDCGVDLNRNYDMKWDLNLVGSSDNPGKEDYRGKAPFSESETRAVEKVLK